MSSRNPLTRIPFNAWLLLIGVPVAMFWTDFFPTSQMRNLRAASKHVEVLNILFQKDPRFVKLKARPYTGEDGIIMINWEDDTFSLVDRLPEEDVPDVLNIIRATRPPVKVRYRDHLITPHKP